MTYVESNLIPGETVLYRTGLHWVVLVGPIIVACFFALTGLGLLAGSMPGWALFVTLCGAGCVYLGVLGRKATEIAVTNKRVVIKTGLLRRKTFELLLSKVESIGVDEEIMGRMLGYGTVVVRGTGGTPEPFSKVSHPLEFRRQVQQQVETSEQNRFKGQLVTA